MQEDSNQANSALATPETTSVQPVAVQQNSLLKDLLIPASIIIAGIFVGAGLYFGGGASSGNDIAAVPTNGNAPAAEQPTGNISNYDPITEDDYVRNENFDAPIMIIEYSDYDCPFCSRFHDTMKIVAEKYGSNLGWAYRHFPLEQLHPQAPAVAVAAECVGDIGGNDAFWQFTDDYFAERGSGNQEAHGTLIPRLVSEAGVAEPAFTECFESGRMNESVQEDVNDAVETGGRGTPWSILVAPDGTAYPINGALPLASIEQLIDGILEAQ